jgi:spermidine synthase
MITHRRSATAARGSNPATQPNVGRERLPGRTGLAIPALLLFASGAAALIYQVLWIKQLSLVVGVDVYAVTTGVSAFFAGLALGGTLFGWWVDRLARPFLLCAFLQLGIAVLGVAATLVLARAAQPFTALEEVAGPLAWALLFALIVVPAVLMGGTLPILVRSRAPQEGQVGAAGGRLYAAHTAGAIAGALLTSFVLIPLLGVRGTAFAAAAINLAAAAGALGLDRITSPLALAGPVPKRTRLAGEARIALMLYAVAGGIALGYEVVWSQAMVPFMSTRSFAFSVVLATYLTGLVIGNVLYARLADRVRNPWGVFGLLIAAAGLVALLEIAGLGRWLIILQTEAEGAVLALTGSQLGGMCTRFAVAAACIVFMPTALLGAAFPVALRLAVDVGHIGRDVGAVVALNTIGGIAGTVLTGFVLVPALGLVRTLAALAIAAAAVGIFAVMRGPAA